MKLTEKGHITVCENMQVETFWLAWGTHTAELNGVAEILDSTDLKDEVGRTKETYKDFVTPDGAGDIEVAGQKWSISVTPTKYMYLKFTFPQDQNTTETIRQMALFTDVQLSTGSEAVTYIDTSVDKLSNMDDIGNIFETRNQIDLVRDSTTSEKYDIIITF